MNCPVCGSDDPRKSRATCHLCETILVLVTGEGSNSLAEVHPDIRHKVYSAVSATISMIDRMRQLPCLFIAGYANKEDNDNFVPMEFGDREAKKRFTDAFRFASKKAKVDFTLAIFEAWGLFAESGDDAEIESYLKGDRSLQESPNRVEVVQFQLQTRDGVWVAAPRIYFEKDVRKLAKIKFEKATSANPEGIFTNLMGI